MLSLRLNVIRSYKNLLRAQKLAFAGDIAMQVAASKEIRRKFKETSDIESGLKNAQDAADFLKV